MMQNKKYLISLLLAFLLPGAVFADDPLPPEEAFKFDATVDGNTIHATWTAADDYYMYRDKFRFESASDGVVLGEPVFPKGKMHHGIKPDGTEGDVETYVHSVTIDVPVQKGGGEIKLIARGQGCAEKLGICYPPQKREKLLTLAAAEPQQPAGGINSISDLSTQLGVNNADAGNEPLPGEQAFQYSAVMEGDVLVATWTIARDYYMYKDKFQFEPKTPGVSFGQIKLPRGKMHHGILPDGSEGEVEIYTDHVVVEVPVKASKDGVRQFDYVAIGQGCAEVFGICYPPQKRPQMLETAAALPGATVASTDDAVKNTANVASNATDFVSEQDKSAQILASGNTFKIILYFFLGGLALAFTACMYPMIPILSSIIVGQGTKVTTMHAFNLSLFYVVSMAVTFGVMGGIFAGVAQGVNLQSYFQSPWILIPFSILFVALAMSMFGFFTIQMPAGLQGKLSEISSNQKSGSFIGVIIMGVLSALIIGPCAGPVIIGALAYAASVGNVFLGFLSMFVLGMGLGVPLIIVGVSHGKFLPKAGGWMDTVKYAAGFVLLAIALLFLERVSFIPTKLVMLLWASLLIVAGIYMGAIEPIKDGASGWRKLWKGLGLVAVFYGAIVMLGGLTGARNVNDPMHGSALTMGGGGGHEQAKLGFKRIKTAADLQRELDVAKASGKFVMLDFYADWCAYCKTFEDYVFSDKDVQSLLRDFVLIQADVTKSDELDQVLLKQTGVIAPPAILFWGPDGVEKKKYRIVGAMDAKQFINRVNLIIRGN